MSISKNTFRISTLFLSIVLLSTLFLAPVAHAQGVSNTQYVSAASEGSGFGVQVGLWIMSTGAYITLFGGSLLDNALSDFVIHLATTLKEGGIADVINDSWDIIKNVSNIVFIFGFIYIGIATILNPSSSRLKGFIAQLIIAAILINFSLFFVKALIDITNFFAYQTLTLFGGDAENLNLAYSFMQAMGLSTLYEISNTTIASFSSGGAVAFFIAGTLFLLIAGFVFAAAAILLTVRFVALILFMIFSPLLFIGAVFTSMREWWMKLISYAIYAPVFLFLMYLSVRILNASAWTKETDLATLLASGADTTDGFAVILQFTVATIFLLVSLKAADKLGVMGGKTAITVGNKIRGYGQRAVGAGTFGLAAAAGRGTAGRAGAWAEGKLKNPASKSGITGFAARRGLTLSRAAADASFDARKVGGVGKKIGIGEGQKGGFKTVREEIKKKEEKYSKNLGTVSDTDEKMKEWQAKIDTTDAEINTITEQQKVAPESQKNELQGRLDALKFQQENYKQAKEYEKNRRQIGDAAANGLMGTMSHGQRSNLNAAFRDIAVADSPERKQAAVLKLAQMKKDIQEEIKKTQPDTAERGYAGVLESSLIASWVKGRIAANDNYAGKEIRSAVEKNLKKSKEDKQTDRIVNTLKEKSA